MKIKIAMLITLFIGGILYINHLKSQVDYLNIDCPQCGSCEVLNYGHDDINMCQKGHCSTCGCDIIVED